MIDPIDHSYADLDQFECFEEDAVVVSIMRYIIFTQLILTCGSELLFFSRSSKLVIDSGRTMNAISKSAMAKFDFKPEPHPRLFKVAYVDQTSLPVTHCYLVPLKLGLFLSEDIQCDVLPVDIAL